MKDYDDAVWEAYLQSQFKESMQQKQRELSKFPKRRLRQFVKTFLSVQKEDFPMTLFKIWNKESDMSSSEREFFMEKVRECFKKDEKTLDLLQESYDKSQDPSNKNNEETGEA